MVSFYVRGDNATPLGSTNVASSMYLSIASTDQTNILTWEEYVPWDNYQYNVYRRNETTGQFDSIGYSNSNRYEDRGLINGQEYCYYVKSIGTYSIGGVVNPILNNSQESCGIPIDTVPPCPPVLTVSNLCNDADAEINGPPFQNNLSWTNPNVTCGGS